MNTVSQDDLMLLSKPELVRWAKYIEVASSGTKADIVGRIHKRVCYEELTKEQLRGLCFAKELCISGTKLELTSRLLPPGKKADAGSKKRQTKIISASKEISHALNGPMTRGKYRKALLRLNLIEEDQDVFHVISTKNGGVDHTDNFHYAQNSSYNRAIGYKFDHVNCYLAGKVKAGKAVAVSRKLGGYSGPSASVLYKDGESFWRDARARTAGRMLQVGQRIVQK